MLIESWMTTGAMLRWINKYLSYRPGGRIKGMHLCTC